MMAYRAAGISIPRTSQAQWQFGTRIPEPAAEPGDLVFFAGGDETPQAPGHVGIVIGDGKMIEAYAINGHRSGSLPTASRPHRPAIRSSSVSPAPEL